MIRIKPSKLLVVAAATSSVPVQANKKVIHVNDGNRVFPAIYQHMPDSIILDYDYLSADTERILRRLRANTFYHKIKVCCYKSTSNTKVDDLLKTLGVQQFIYAEDAKAQLNQQKSAFKTLSEILEARVMSNLAEASF